MIFVTAAANRTRTVPKYFFVNLTIRRFDFGLVSRKRYRVILCSSLLRFRRFGTVLKFHGNKRRSGHVNGLIFAKRSRTYRIRGRCSKCDHSSSSAYTYVRVSFRISYYPSMYTMIYFAFTKIRIYAVAAISKRYYELKNRKSIVRLVEKKLYRN